MPLLHLNEQERIKEKKLRESQKKVLKYAQDFINNKLTQDEAWEKIEKEIKENSN